MRRASILLLFLLLALLAALAILRPDALSWSSLRTTPESASRSPSEPHGSDSPISSNQVQAGQTQSIATGASNPTDRAAMAWFSRAQAVMQAGRAKSFGPQVAALMAKPPSEAWPVLKALSDAGDVNASSAAVLLAMECSIARAALAKGPPKPGGAMAVLYKGLPQERLDLLQAIDTREIALQFARYAECARVDTTLDFMELVGRALDSNDPGLQLHEADEMESDADAIALLRDLAAHQDTDEARRTLAERLIRSADPAQQREGRELLEALAVDDPQALAQLASCLRKGCSHFTGDTSVARAWLERAAGGGDWFSLSQLVDDFSAAHANVDAWAWARYRLELATAACFNQGSTANIWLAQSIQGMQRLDAALSTTQRLEAENRWRELSTQWLAAARVSQACSP